MAALENTASLWLDQAVGHHVEGDLTADEALALTAKIKSYVGVTWLLLNEAHKRRADKALGYGSWAEYVEAEYDMSRSYAYRLIAHAKAVYELAGVAGLSDVSPIGDIPEGKTRAIDIDEVAAEVERQAAALPADATDEDRADVVRRALARQTTTKTTTETTTTDFDPETGEVLSGVRPEHLDENATQQGAGDDGPASEGDATSGGDGADSHDVGRTEPEPAPTSSEGGSRPVGAPSDSPSVPPVDPVLGYRATATRFRAQVRQSLLTLDPERVIDTSDEPDHWAEFSQDMHDWLRRLDEAIRAGRHLRAVK